MNNFNRRSIRLRNYDYSQAGAYFVTICCQDRQCYFGRIKNRKIELSIFGHIIKMNWENIPGHFKNVILDEYVIMPNHMHGIIIINGHRFNIGRGEVTSPLPMPQSPLPMPRSLLPMPQSSPWLKKPTLGQIIAYFKYQSTKQVNRLRNSPGTKLWQRNYYEHIIRNELEINRIRKYIFKNPLQ